MNSYDVRLEGREEIAEGTMAFHFEKPSTFLFKPGQALDVVLFDQPDLDAQNTHRVLSIVSAPFEGGLTTAARMRDSPFKRTLKSLPMGAQVRLRGPFGTLTLQTLQQRPAVLIAGGIGITPFMSILRQATREQLSQDLVLLYSNRRPEDTAFLAELQNLEQQNKHFRLVATMTQMSQSNMSWTGNLGTIDKKLILHAGKELMSPIYCVVGPPGMVETICQTLNLAGVPKGDIRMETFHGY